MKPSNCTGGPGASRTRRVPGEHKILPPLVIRQSLLYCVGNREVSPVRLTRKENDMTAVKCNSLRPALGAFLLLGFSYGWGR